MRKAMVAGNWKMNGSRTAAHSLIESIKHDAKKISGVDIAIFPSFIYLPLAQHLLEATPILWGAQNLYPGESGAFTGEVSGPMLADYGCQLVLVGHSERRHIFHEDLETVALKFKAARAAKLKPVLCIGETEAEREQGATEEVLSAQLESVIAKNGIESLQDAILAYEPVWAIGTGLTATPEQAQAVHAFIRELLAKHQLNVSKTTQILYGGSVKADNASGLFAMPDIDGALVGGASLDAQSFLAICQQAIKN